MPTDLLHCSGLFSVMTSSLFLSSEVWLKASLCCCSLSRRACWICRRCSAPSSLVSSSSSLWLPLCSQWLKSQILLFWRWEPPETGSFFFLLTFFKPQGKLLPGAYIQRTCISVLRSVWKHFRGLSMCLLLLVFPVFMAYKISQFFHMDFWLLILVSSCMLTSLQVGTVWVPFWNDEGSLKRLK